MAPRIQSKRGVNREVTVKLICSLLYQVDWRGIPKEAVTLLLDLNCVVRDCNWREVLTAYTT